MAPVRRLGGVLASALLLTTSCRAPERPPTAVETPPVRSLAAEHGIVCRLADDRRGSFGWPTVARLQDGTVLVASSGLRSFHVCPHGKTVLHESHDDGRTWSPTRVIQDSPIDDRDAGIVALGGRGVLVSWFRSDTRQYAEDEWIPAAERASWQETLSTWDDAQVETLLGSWVMRSDDGGATWGQPIRAPVSAPHGPIRLASGDLLYVGKQSGAKGHVAGDGIVATRSSDGGATWRTMGRVPLASDTDPVNYHEPHAVELPSGKLIAAIRLESRPGKELAAAGMPSFTIMQTESVDGGTTWSVPRWLGFKGSPPHLVRHSSGALVMSYGYRDPPFGQRIAISRDEGRTWTADWVLRGDGPDWDLGYPSTVELADGSLLTVCYQKAAAEEPCALLWSRWRLPAAEPQIASEP